MERRAAHRIPLALKCHLVTDPTAAGQQVGRTENISRSGVLVNLPERSACVAMLNPGDHVELHLELPSRLGRRLPRSLHCLATVAWSKAAPDGNFRVALAVHRMSFRDLPERLWSLEHAWQDCQVAM
jgi:hypothetical protein